MHMMKQIRQTEQTNEENLHYNGQQQNIASRKHAYIILTPLNPTFIE